MHIVLFSQYPSRLYYSYVISSNPSTQQHNRSAAPHSQPNIIAFASSNAPSCRSFPMNHGAHVALTGRKVLALYLRHAPWLPCTRSLAFPQSGCLPAYQAAVNTWYPSLQPLGAAPRLTTVSRLRDDLATLHTCSTPSTIAFAACWCDGAGPS